MKKILTYLHNIHTDVHISSPSNSASCLLIMCMSYRMAVTHSEKTNAEERYADLTAEMKVCCAMAQKMSSNADISVCLSISTSLAAYSTRPR